MDFQNTTAYQSSDTFGLDDPRTIYLYTTPLGYHRKYLGLKKPIDSIAHWAICIQDRCYELTRNTESKKPKYKTRSLPEHKWLELKGDEQRGCKREAAGRMQTLYPRETIERVAEEVWEKSLQRKYVYDEHNCQVFIRLVVELIGDQQTKAKFPSFFDTWIKRAGISRDVSFLTIAVGGSAMAASLATTAVDPTGSTAIAGVLLSSSIVVRSSTALLTDRHIKEKHIEKAQVELRDKFTKNGTLVM